MNRCFWPGAIVAALLLAGCARVTVEGGEKPIRIEMDVTVRIARELDNFFAFQEEYQPTTDQAPATRPVTESTL